MPVPPLSVTLSDGQKVEAMKRFRVKYAEELGKLDQELTDVLTALAEADFLSQYLGEQPEIVDLRKRKTDVEALEKRRQYLSKIIERLDQYTPQQKSVSVAPPNMGTGAQPARPGGGGLKRY
ncbi:MAG: hypothetical protein H0X38_01575 [Planctomycetes bacterium]|nr:hypothetical protein [Planctomycetota bacterium]